MTLPEAKKLIAGYLSGARVARERLEVACGVAQSDRDYVRHLRDELGFHADWVSECDVFRSRLAEFSELSEDERSREMPELVAHVEVCLDCRRALWELRPRWGEGAAPRVRYLTGSISVVLRADGVLPVGQGPPPLQREVAGKAAAAPATEALEGRFAPGAPVAEPRDLQEWLLRDPEAECAVCITVSRLASGDASVHIRLESEGGPPVDESTARVESRRVCDEGPLGAGRAGVSASSLRRDVLHSAYPLGSLPARGFVLPPGSWRIRLVVGEPSEGRVWVIPLEIAAEDGPGRA